MNESFVHYVWQYQYFVKSELHITSGEILRIITPGIRNADAGPDFQNARIQVGEMQWVGSVEIHIDASSWFEHSHDHDEAYDNVILHVVWRNDVPVFRRDGSIMPTLELRDRVDEDLISRFRNLAHSVDAIPCAGSLRTVRPVIILNTLDKMLAYRLRNKALEVTSFVERNKGDWEEAAYQLLARNFGFRVNSDPFLQLALALPLKILMKHRDKLLQIEAMLFGVAGFLEDSHTHPYYQLLQREYNLLRQKYRLDHKAMKKVQWKFLRLRPANFPTLRIAQFAAFLFNHCNILSVFLEGDEEKLRSSFRHSPSEYWQDHYNFIRTSSRREAVPGEDSINNLFINTVVPVLAAYAITHDDHRYMEKANRMLHGIAPESNHVVRKWRDLSVVSSDAFDSQALLELYNNFCSRHRCLDCNIGASLIKPQRQ